MTEGMIGPLKRRAEANATARPSARKKVAGLVVVIGAIALLAVALVPASNSTDAYPDREGGCGCHSTQATFLTVNGLPTGTYTPGLQYAVDVIVADPNGLTGENAFSFRITLPTVGGGTLATTDPNVEINTAIQASANDTVIPMTATQWTVLWTAPASGAVTINITAVVNQTSILGTPPYDRYTVTLTEGAAIPEFPALLIPVVGIGLAVVVAAKVTRRSK
jgi:hypothetical protein